jgi:hypothetical protein
MNWPAVGSLGAKKYKIKQYQYCFPIWLGLHLSWHYYENKIDIDFFNNYADTFIQYYNTSDEMDEKHIVQA